MRQKSLGGSALTAHTKNLPPVYRHHERLKINLQHQDKLRKWCKSHGFDLKIDEDGRHWKVVGPGRDGFIFVEWWPWLAKLYFAGDELTLHCHDYQQLIGAIEERL
jgi:hypothetical protein